jgi:hypothetical protein
VQLEANTLYNDWKANVVRVLVHALKPCGSAVNPGFKYSSLPPPTPPPRPSAHGVCFSNLISISSVPLTRSIAAQTTAFELVVSFVISFYPQTQNTDKINFRLGVFVEVTLNLERAKSKC